jgi:3-dehydroquinate synthase
MANRVIVSSGHKIFFEGDSFSQLNKFLGKRKYTSYYILCDGNTLHFCLPKLILGCPKLSEAEIIELESGELSKNLEVCAHIWQTLIENQADRNSLLINLGGGVVSDIGGFVASVYKRGIDFINIPTTLLAMADASVGGKNGVDFLSLKNIIGTFSPPSNVYIHHSFLETLPNNHYKNGMAEIFKIALVSDNVFWSELQNEKITSNSRFCISKSVELKNKIVLADLYDKGQRQILNFGHTIGHAIESYFLGSPKFLLHGEAIVKGMIIESHISFQKKLISKKVLNDVVKSLVNYFQAELINFEAKTLLKLMLNDKKASDQQLKFCLLSGIGKAKIDVKVNESEILKAIDFYRDLHHA